MAIDDDVLDRVRHDLTRLHHDIECIAETAQYGQALHGKQSMDTRRLWPLRDICAELLAVLNTDEQK